MQGCGHFCQGENMLNTTTTTIFFFFTNNKLQYLDASLSLEKMECLSGHVCLKITKYINITRVLLVDNFPPHFSFTSTWSTYEIRDWGKNNCNGNFQDFLVRKVPLLSKLSQPYCSQSLLIQLHCMLCIASKGRLAAQK